MAADYIGITWYTNYQCLFPLIWAANRSVFLILRSHVLHRMCFLTLNWDRVFDRRWHLQFIYATKESSLGSHVTTQIFLRRQNQSRRNSSWSKAGDLLSYLCSIAVLKSTLSNGTLHAHLIALIRFSYELCPSLGSFRFWLIYLLSFSATSKLRGSAELVVVENSFFRTAGEPWTSSSYVLLVLTCKAAKHQFTGPFLVMSWLHKKIGHPSGLLWVHVSLASTLLSVEWTQSLVGGLFGIKSLVYLMPVLAVRGTLVEKQEKADSLSLLNERIFWGYVLHPVWDLPWT